MTRLVLVTGFPSFQSLDLPLVVHGFTCLLTALIIRSCFYCYGCAEPTMQFKDAVAYSLLVPTVLNVLTFNHEESKSNCYQENPNIF